MLRSHCHFHVLTLHPHAATIYLSRIELADATSDWINLVAQAHTKTFTRGTTVRNPEGPDKLALFRAQSGGDIQGHRVLCGV
jgi:hypothetical protein